ncbi:hypothetical protein AAMO2058_000501700 [Amorphochlora amoebiformis]
MPALVMLAMAVFAPLVLGQEPEEELDDVTIETLMKPYKCSDKVQVGDTIRIRHDGFWQGSKIDSDDGPLEIRVGARHVLEGMERGLVGQCIDEVRLVTIPPQLAYDHPEMNFGAGRKPVPEGSTVAYRMKVVYIAPRPGSFAYLMAPVQEFLEGHYITLCCIVIGFGLWYYQSYTAEKAQKVKKRNKMISTIKKATKKKQ